MAGTGKSQVVRAVRALFGRIGKSEMLKLTAPTGSAAVVIGGTTYHSLLGFLYNHQDVAFGGINIITCGDFAQLAPVGGNALYDPLPSTKNNKMKLTQQKSAIGMALWHQFTTVVLLRKNMRQFSMKAEDKAYRVALENMRYKACTIKDSTLILNDKINIMGSLHFAHETNQTLTDFYSIDSLTEVQNRKQSKKQSKNTGRKSHISIHPAKQFALWNLHPDLSGHKAGILSLCIGLPVMIKKNVATELGITNGAEANVVGWKSHVHKMWGKDINILDVLFIKIKNPVIVIRLPGLPENVVPLTRLARKVKCQLPNGHIETINRDQIEVLPNFAMTDYSSQGRTR
ncbi:hypothetical protein M422DRAFT_119341, partial [Sphaerobolus stellatus SS14]